MRKYLIYGSLGLLSIGWISGCDTFRNLRGDHTDTTTPRSGIVPKSCSECQAAPSDPKAKVAVAKKANDPSPAVAKEGMESVAISPPAVASNRPAPPVIFPENPREPLKTPDLPPSPKVVLEFPPPPEKAVVKNAAPVAPPLASRVVPPPPPLPSIAPLPPIVPEPTTNTIEVEPRTAKEKTSVAPKAEVRPGQAEQFKSVTGEVQGYRKTWRLRYAPIDQVDIYGGVVVLEGGAELSKLRDGQHVRVRGELIPPAEPNGSAHYRVASIEMLD